MPDINVRQTIIDSLAPLLPDDWEMLPYGRTHANLDHVAVTLTMKRIMRDPAHPQSGWRAYEATLTILHPNQDAEQVWEPLDDDLIDLLNALDEAGPQLNLRWTTAEFGMGNDAGDGPRNFGFDITIQYYYRKD